MAHQKKCPHCKKITDNQKKGKSGDKQRYKCAVCKKQWTEGVSTTGSKSAKKAPKRKPAKKTNQAGKTVIIVNNNTIRNDIKGKLNKDDALEIAGEYFKEIQRDKVAVKDVGDTRTYTFKIPTGRKG